MVPNIQIQQWSSSVPPQCYAMQYNAKDSNASNLLNYIQIQQYSSAAGTSMLYKIIHWNATNLSKHRMHRCCSTSKMQSNAFKYDVIILPNVLQCNITMQCNTECIGASPTSMLYIAIHSNATNLLWLWKRRMQRRCYTSMQSIQYITLKCN